MKIDDFRAHAHTMVDWMADYMSEVEQYPVRSALKPREFIAKLPASAPQNGESMTTIFDDFKRDVLPGMTHWQHPGFFAYFTANTSPPSVLAEMLMATLGAQCMLWQTSPAATEMEERVCDWLRQMIGLPDDFSGVIQDSATSATLVALLTAREQKTAWQANEVGLNALGDAGKLCVYCSVEAHSSIEKGVKIAGYGKAALRKVAADAEFAMDVDALRAAIMQDRAAGAQPAAVVASLGGTSVGAIDNIRAIGEVCRELGIWLHVDAAWAGSALILPELAHLLDGIDNVDSFVFNPHKWLLTNFDCSVYFVRDPAALERTLALVPEYLKSSHARGVTDYQNWSVPLGRRFRALKLWFVLRSYGVAGLQAIVRNHLQWAADLFDKVAAHPQFEIISPLRFSLFSFRYRPDAGSDDATLDALNETLIERINERGRIYLTQTRVNGRYAIRFTVGQTNTAKRHVDAAWVEIQAVAAELQ